jgi:hypothetical protein
MSLSEHPRIWNVVALVAITAATLTLAGCVNNSSAEDPLEDTPPTGASGQDGVADPPPTETPSADGVKRFDIDLTATGFKVRDGQELRVKVGDSVKVVFHHAEPYGDDHPIYFTCTGRAATVTKTAGSAEMAFVAKKAGTCAFFCTNGDCGPHQTLQNGKIFVEA